MTLPAEQPLTDFEKVFIEESPHGLWPENQDSYFGQLRYVLTMPLQTLADQIGAMYTEMFVASSTDWLTRWEQNFGIPALIPTPSNQLRRNRILTHIRKGAFTRTTRKAIIENYIYASQGIGVPTSILPDGIDLSSGAGVTLYGESVPADISNLYSINEDLANFAYRVNVDPSLTPDFQAISRELSHFTPAGITFTITQYTNNKYDDALMDLLPISYWRLTETAGPTAFDETNRNPGTYTGGITYSQTGPTTSVSPNRAVLLNGTTGYITIPDSASLDPGDTFTIIAWIKTNSGATNGVVSKRNAGYSMTYGRTAGRIAIEKEGTAVISTATNTVNDNAWHMAVWTKAGATNKIYIDNVDRTGTVTNQTIAATTGAVELGRLDGTNYFNGSLDRIALFDYALSPAQISTLWNAK